MTIRQVSPLARGRGLKQRALSAPQAALRIAPRAGAWIETSTGTGGAPRSRRSPLARGRGLKLPSLDVPLNILVSPLARGRGLKPVQLGAICSIEGIACPASTTLAGWRQLLWPVAGG